MHYWLYNPDLMHFSQRYIPQPCKQVLKSFELTSQCYLMSVPSYILCHLTLAFSYNLAAFWWQQCSTVNNKKDWKGFQFLRLSVFKGFKMKKKTVLFFFHLTLAFSYNLALFWWQQCSTVNNKKRLKRLQNEGNILQT